jgi:hypothetical protein
VRLARLFRPRNRGPRDCTCGHAAQAHEHYRRGSDCALCACAKFRAGAPAVTPREQQDAHSERVHAA